MKRRWLLILGILAFGWTLLIHAPAAVLYGWFAPVNGPTQLLGMEGSLSEGRLAGVVGSSGTLLRDLRWRLQPMRLLLLQAAFHIDLVQPLAVSGRVEIAPWGTRIANAHVTGSLKDLLAAAGLAYLPVDGLVGGDIGHLSLHHGRPTSAAGKLQLHGVVWSLAKPPIQLGDFDAAVEDAGDAIVAHISSPSGPLDSHGEIKLMADGSYVSDILFKAKPEASEMTQNLLHSMGEPDAQGYYHARASGQLTPTATPGPSPNAAAMIEPDVQTVAAISPSPNSATATTNLATSSLPPLQPIRGQPRAD